MFAGIKCQDDRVGERGARTEWAWEYWQNDWVFREDSEVWGEGRVLQLAARSLIICAECPLPPLSALLETLRIKETDSFVICVQIHSPVGPFFPQQPSAAYVPRDLLDGLEASLDNASTFVIVRLMSAPTTLLFFQPRGMFNLFVSNVGTSRKHQIPHQPRRVQKCAQTDDPLYHLIHSQTPTRLRGNALYTPTQTSWFGGPSTLQLCSAPLSQKITLNQDPMEGAGCTPLLSKKRISARFIGS